MCGRYYRQADKQRIADAFRLGRQPDNFVLPPDYNIAPTTFQPVIRQSRDTRERELVMMRWGLVLYFAKSPTDYKGFSTINATAESVQGRELADSASTKPNRRSGNAAWSGGRTARRTGTGTWPAILPMRTGLLRWPLKKLSCELHGRDDYLDSRLVAKPTEHRLRVRGSMFPAHA